MRIADFTGRVFRPGDTGYDEARAVYNSLIDRHPALIVRAAAVDDVVAAVNLAREHRLPLAVRGGGHSIAGFSTCDDGLVLDLGDMNRVEVDPARRTARAGPGCTWGRMNDAAHAHGLATTGGLVSTTGIAGLTLGGGIGYLARRFGLACDNLLSAEVVTAAGEIVTCSEDRNEDLFWALRGGGGNFGVVVSFEFRLHPVSEILGGPTFFPAVADVPAAYAQLMADAPEDLGAVLAFALAPPAPFVPTEWHGKPVTAVIACWSGEPRRGRALLDTMTAWAPVVGRSVGPMPYPAINTLFDDLLPRGLRNYWKGHFAKGLAVEAIDVHLRYGATMPSIETSTLLLPVNGACHRVAPHESAFAWRDADFAVGLGAVYRDPGDDDANIKWTRSYYEELEAYSLGGGYVNFSSDDDDERVRANYRGNYERLVAVKRRYDPDNLFRLNQNVRPEPAASPVRE